MMDNRKIFQEKYPYYYAERQRRYNLGSRAPIVSSSSRLVRAHQYGVVTPPLEEMYGQLMVELRRELPLVGMPFIQALTRIAEIDHVHSKIDISVWDFTGPLRPISTGPLSSFR